ncbi:MAG: DUF3592 domain-containing protein [Terracidiphilus sp.]|jgi:hypothetical protein
MLIEIWERLRGYDKWTQTEATVESSVEQKDTVVYRGNKFDEYSSNDVIVWKDAQGEKQYADFTVQENSPLFQLIDGNSVSIRFNPAKPDEFYYRDLLRERVRKFVGSALVILFIATLIVLRIWTGMLMRH